MSVATSPTGTHVSSDGQPGQGGIWTRPGWWRALLYTVVAIIIAVALPMLIRYSVGWHAFQYEVISV